MSTANPPPDPPPSDRIPIDSTPPTAPSLSSTTTIIPSTTSKHQPPSTERTALIQAALRQQHSLLILSHIEHLLTLPTSSPSSDITLIKSLLPQFTPKDYDDLLEERNISGTCGFALCSKKPINGGGGSMQRHKVKVTSSGKVVESWKVGRFCGEQCARRAMYLRVQLDETPGWMRKDTSGSGGGVGNVRESGNSVVVKEEIRMLDEGEK